MAAGASVVGVQREESTAPGAASAARAGVGRLVLLGDPPSFDEDVSDPHCCVKPLDAVALAVACGDRGVSESTWAAGLLFGADGVAVTVSVDRTAGDTSLATATTSNATTVSASMQDICRVPSRPASFPNVSRGRRLPGAMSTSPAIGRMAHPVDPPLPPVDRAAWRIRAHAGTSPAASTITTFPCCPKWTRKERKALIPRRFAGGEISAMVPTTSEEHALSPQRAW